MRNTDISSVFFPVDLRPVIVEGAGAVRGLQGVMDVERKRVLSVVSNHYQLVTNLEAANYGRQCFASVFGEKAADAIQVFHVNLSETRAACTMDFTHEGSEFSPFEGDPWLPFLRVTNSYNGSMSLRFRVGFCRGICTNGMIFGDRSMQFRFEHTRRDIPRISFRSAVGDTGGLQEDLVANLMRMNSIRVQKNQMLPLACRVLRVFPKEQDIADKAKWRRLTGWRDRIGVLTNLYFSEQGDNAYAALSVLTDFASRPSHVHTGVAMTDRLQRHSAAWMSGFVVGSRRLGFSVERYVKDYRGYADLLSRN